MGEAKRRREMDEVQREADEVLNGRVMLVLYNGKHYIGEEARAEEQGILAHDTLMRPAELVVFRGIASNGIAMVEVIEFMPVEALTFPPDTPASPVTAAQAVKYREARAKASGILTPDARQLRL